jgi:hypothetical protein
MCFNTNISFIFFFYKVLRKSFSINIINHDPIEHISFERIYMSWQINQLLLILTVMIGLERINSDAMS